MPADESTGESRDESTNFHLDKSTSSLFETGKKIESATILSVFTLAIAVLVASSGAPNDKVTVPLISLELPKWNAASFAILLFAVSWFRLILFIHAHNLLISYTKTLLKEKGYGSTIFHLRYPSTIGILVDARDLDRRGLGIFAAFLGILVASATVGIGLMIWYVGHRSGWGVFWFFTSAISVALVIASFVITGILPKGYSTETVLKKLGGTNKDSEATQNSSE